MNICTDQIAGGPMICQNNDNRSRMIQQIALKIKIRFVRKWLFYEKRGSRIKK